MLRIFFCFFLLLGCIRADDAECDPKLLITQPVEETFETPSKLFSVSNQELGHCDTHCTYYSSSLVQFGAPLSGVYAGQNGLMMNLSRSYCQSANCCVNDTCANWAGSHLSSNTACIQYGTVELEAQMMMPTTTGGNYFLGIYRHGTKEKVPVPGDNTTWNEIDIGLMTVNDRFEMHATYFAPTMNVLRVPHSLGWGQQWHMYKVVWTPDVLEWFIDGLSVRRVTASYGHPVPWRPQSLRFIFRVSDADPESTGDDAALWIRQFRYTPLPSKP